MQSQKVLENNGWESLLVGSGSAMRQVKELARLVGQRKATVLITGETGTGKELVAKSVHQASDRRHRPMVSVNCAAIPATLIEAELFGHTKGAFTGAASARRGYLEEANQGTIFLDEIGELPLELQAKLLRFLQERQIQRLGSSETSSLDVRVIAATNSDLLEAVHQKRFRQDLYYRLNVVPIKLPALRHRMEDIAELTDHFLSKICSQEGLTLKRLNADALSSIRAYSWPGNVRELEHALERAVALSGDRSILHEGDFDLCEPGTGTSSATFELELSIPESGIDFERTLIAFQRELFQQAMRKSAGNKQKAANLLGLKRTTLISKFKALEAHAA